MVATGPEHGNRASPDDVLFASRIPNKRPVSHVGVRVVIPICVLAPPVL
jgi:hypothetical protein